MATITNYLRLMRLDKPIGIWLLYFPAAVALCLSQPMAPEPHRLFLLFLGAVLTRSAGCIINDLTDRKLDAQVERTRHRPLASGAITVPEALVLLAVLGLGCLLVVVLLPARVFTIALLAVPMIAAYPWMKRLTWWPQLFLGFTFNLGVWMGWAASGAPITHVTTLVYLGFMAWTLGYDTLYALQDEADDARVGIKSSARRLKKGYEIGRFVGTCYVVFLMALLISGVLVRTGPLYLLGIVAVALQLKGQVRDAPFARVEHTAGALFRSNQWVGLMLFIALYLDRLAAWVPTWHPG